MQQINNYEKQLNMMIKLTKINLIKIIKKQKLVYIFINSKYITNNLLKKN